jgi:hypothetical protein
VEICQKAIELAQEALDDELKVELFDLLGRAFLAQGDRVKALEQFQPFCRRFREENPELDDLPFAKWFSQSFLEPAAVGTVRSVLVVQDQCEPPFLHDEFVTSLAADWVWEDPFGDCSFAVKDGLEIHAANGRDLWHINWSAPRVLRPASGDWAAQAVCTPISGEKPTIGGLLLWKNRQNYLRLDRGYTGKRDILFGGCLANEDVVGGRGRLEESAGQPGPALGRGQPSGGAYLRLERAGDRVGALCSADGERWFTVGHVEFPVDDPIQVGLHAIGSIDRTVYRGAYPDSTAIRFESFQLWGLNR